MARQTFNSAKFRELIIYISERSQDDLKFGATKLNKILYFSDFVHFGETGKPITGAQYQRLGQGPAPRELVPIRTDLVQKNELYLQPRKYLGGGQVRPVALRKPDLSLFHPEEIATVDRVIEDLKDDNATSVSDRTHSHIGWLYAAQKEVIPYETVFIKSIQPLQSGDLE